MGRVELHSQVLCSMGEICLVGACLEDLGPLEGSEFIVVNGEKYIHFKYG